MIPAIVLAAGLSTRMGQSKALLRARPDGPTFVAQLTSSLRAAALADVRVVGRPDDLPLVRKLETAIAAIRFVANEHADQGQLSSVLAGLNAADRPGVTAVLVAPVDAPRVRPETIVAVLDAFAT